MDGTNFREICDENGCRIIDIPYDVQKIHHTDAGIELIPVKMKGTVTGSSEDIGRVDIKLFSDYMCPWCLLGHSIIESLSKKYDIHIEHAGIELYPDTEIHGKDISGNACSENAVRRINHRSREYGFQMPNMLFRPNTHKALLAGEYAKSIGTQDAFVRAMWKAYLLERRNIGEIEEIKYVAETVGIPAEEIDMAIKNPSFENSLAENNREASLYNIKAVPSFVINDRYLVCGVEDEDFFEKIIERL